MKDVHEFYSLEYESFINEGIVGLGSRLTHWTLERTPNRSRGGIFKRLSNENLRILEVGAGNGQHLKSVSQNFLSYEMTDLRPEMLPKVNGNVKVNKKSVSAESLPYPEECFDRVIASCLLAHLDEPQVALREWKRVLKPTGYMTIYAPCEPGILLRALRAVITNPKKKKMGITEVELWQYRDHINSYLRLKAEILSLSSNVRVRRYPFPFLSWNFNLWAVFTVSFE